MSCTRGRECHQEGLSEGQPWEHLAAGWCVALAVLLGQGAGTLYLANSGFCRTGRLYWQDVSGKEM